EPGRHGRLCPARPGAHDTALRRRRQPVPVGGAGFRGLHDRHQRVPRRPRHRRPLHTRRAAARGGGAQLPRHRAGARRAAWGRRRALRAGALRRRRASCRGGAPPATAATGRRGAHPADRPRAALPAGDRQLERPQPARRVLPRHRADGALPVRSPLQRRGLPARRHDQARPGRLRPRRPGAGRRRAGGARRRGRAGGRRVGAPGRLPGRRQSRLRARGGAPATGVRARRGGSGGDRRIVVGAERGVGRRHGDVDRRRRRRWPAARRAHRL
ncbi:MAG: hypothetical protein AVDCRST_MAG38-950, partial [uncultured Solirubrobacteraceae bacterium]